MRVNSAAAYEEAFDDHSDLLVNTTYLRAANDGTLTAHAA